MFMPLSTIDFYAKGPAAVDVKCKKTKKILPKVWMSAMFISE